jgi:hypothetical protein
MSRSGSPSVDAILEESPSEDDSESTEGESSVFPLQRACSTVIPAVPTVTMPLSEETTEFQTAPTRPQRTTTPIPLPEPLVAHQEEWQSDIKQKTVRHQGEPTGTRGAVEARLVDLHQGKLAFEAG